MAALRHCTRAVSRLTAGCTAWQPLAFALQADDWQLQSNADHKRQLHTGLASRGMRQTWPQHCQPCLQHQAFQAALVRQYQAISTTPPATQSTGNEPSDKQILLQLFTYVWPADNPEFKRRVSGALVLLAGSKILNIQVRRPPARVLVIAG